MDIENIIEAITYICIYYYKQYHAKILNHDVNIPDKTIPDLINRIYLDYVKSCETTYVQNILIMPCSYIYGKHYNLEEDELDLNSMMDQIDNFLDNYDFYNNNLTPIKVISFSDLPFTNGVTYTNEWIKQFIDMYRY